MRPWRTLPPLALCALLLTTGSAPAQPQPPQTGPPPDAPPVSVERIKLQLAQKPPSEGEGLKLNFYVEVIGRAPRIDLFSPEFSWAGPAPWGGMTHREFLNVVTPEEFRAPVIPLVPGVLTQALSRLVSGKVREAKERQVRDEVTRERIAVELQYVGGAGARCTCDCGQRGCTCALNRKLRGSTFSVK